MISLSSIVLGLLKDACASDVHLTVGEPLWYRLHGDMHRYKNPEGEEFTLTENMINLFMEDIRKDVPAHDALAGNASSDRSGDDFAATINGFRVRGNLALANGKKLSLVLRGISPVIPKPEEIRIPQNLIDMGERSHGLILVTGPTGSGKSTTLASLLDHINHNQVKHIETIEDPVEYHFESAKCKITRKEIGKEAGNFYAALRSAMRQDPDIILVGEIRDYETMRAALMAAETGHLVYATLHTSSAAKTIERVMSFFPNNEKDWARDVVASVLIATISQVLLPKAGGNGRVMAYELMVNTSSIASQIRDNKAHTLNNSLDQGVSDGQISKDMCLIQMLTSNLITTEVALAHGSSAFKEKLGVHQGKAASTHQQSAPAKTAAPAQAGGGARSAL